MTRETKIGLLVGLVFIIVVGILLSENFHGASELPPAALAGAGASARLAVSVPGVTPVAPQPSPVTADVSPRVHVPTPRDIDPVAPPVVPDAPVKPAPAAVDPVLAAKAKEQGVDLVNVGENGAPSQVTESHANESNARPASRSYKAAPGDSVSKLAARFLGANTRTNRDLIIAANPSLKDNPNKIIVGQFYEIPSPASAAQRPAAPAVEKPTPAVLATARWTYTVKSNDTLWGIANTQLGDPTSVNAIMELNRDVLKGGTNVRPGMKLTLPARPIASTN